MTKRDFFRMLIKITGVYFIITVFIQISGVFSYMFAYKSYSDGSDFFEIFAIGFIVLLMLAVIVLLIAKPDILINLFGLDKGYDSPNMEILNSKSLSAVSVIRLGIVIIGGWLFLSNISLFLAECFYVFRDHVSRFEEYNPYNLMERTYFDWVFRTLNIVIGLLLVFNSLTVARFLWKNEEKAENAQTEN